MERPSGPGSITPSWSAMRERRADAGHRHAGARLDVLLDHLPRIHAVDVVGAEHADVVGPLVVDQVEVLVDRVGGAGEPVRALAASAPAPT